MIKLNVFCREYFCMTVTRTRVTTFEFPHVLKIIPLHTAIFNENASLYFLDNVHLLKHYPIKLPQNRFDSCNCPNQAGIQISKILFALDKPKN